MSTLKVLIVDDSPTMRQLLAHVIGNAPDMQVSGIAKNGHEAIRMTQDLRPDVVVMDIVMPGMDGLETTREIMHSQPTPIVMVTASLKKQETDIAFRATRLGALTVLQKPAGPRHQEYDIQVTKLLNVIRAMAGVKVIHHRKQNDRVTLQSAANRMTNRLSKPEIIAIAISTGGPAALSQICGTLPANFSLPIVIVQHISTDFLSSLIEWLSMASKLPISVSQEGEVPQRGHIYFAPGDANLIVSRGRRFCKSSKLFGHKRC